MEGQGYPLPPDLSTESGFSSSGCHVESNLACTALKGAGLARDRMGVKCDYKLERLSAAPAVWGVLNRDLMVRFICRVSEGKLLLSGI